MSESGAYSARFAGPWPDAALRDRIAVKAQRLDRLDRLSTDNAAAKLRDALESVVVPTDQMVAIVRLLIGRAKAYCDRAYPDSRAVLRLIHGSAPTPTSDDGWATCFTGLAGVGKSVILDAFGRIFSNVEQIDIPGHASQKVHACWRMRVHERAGFAALVHPHFRDQTAMRPGRVLGFAVTEAATQGIALILPDEFQFITSSDANALIAKLLFRFTQIGPPVVFACNYSMVNALWRRPQQDRDRLLVDPIIVSPEKPGPDWVATVAGCLDVAEEFSSLRSDSDATLLHDYTFGIKRCLRSLLVLAYVQMRREEKAWVTTDHLSTAYRSIAYSAMRETVENLIQGAVTPALLRKDLKCAFGHNPIPQAKGTVVEDTALRSHAGNVTQAALRSMISPEGRRLLDVSDSHTAVPATPKGKRPLRPPASAENLIGGANRFSLGQKDKS